MEIMIKLLFIYFMHLKLETIQVEIIIKDVQDILSSFCTFILFVSNLIPSI